MNEFNNVILQIATFTLIIILVIIGVILAFSQDYIIFPPYTSECPDGFKLDASGICQIDVVTYSADSNNYPKYVKDLENLPANCQTIDTTQWADYDDDKKFCAKYYSIQDCSGIYWDGITGNKSNLLMKCNELLSE